MTAPTPTITRPPLPADDHVLPRDNDGYGVHEVATIGLCGEFTGQVWQHLTRNTDGIRL